jgi:OOP family OmpA-OmpF porin
MNIGNTTILLSLLCSSFAYADKQACTDEEGNYKNCDNQIGWYIGGDIGNASTDVDSGDLDRFYQDAGVNANSLSFDDSDTSYSLFAGYQFSTYLALEAGYLDLGERSVTFTGQSSDLDAFYDHAEHVYPESGDGFSMAVVGSWPLSESFKISAKLGYFDWQGKYSTYEQSNNVGNDSKSGSDIWFGGEVNYRVNDRFQAYLSAQRFELDRDDTTNITLGIRYYFGDKLAKKYPSDKKIIEIKKAKPATVDTIEHIVKPVDDDKDGVINDIDECPNSDIKHQVDEQGCTVMAEQLIDFSLTVYFASDSSTITAEYQDKITELATYINRYDIKALKVYGHTSAPGSRTYNQQLSLKRAKSVGDILTQQYDIDSDIIEAIGKGETELINKQNTDTAHDVNRRIELTIKERSVTPVKK